MSEVSFTQADSAYAEAYSAYGAEQELPYSLQLKRTRSLVAFYRMDVLELVYQYRNWLARADYLRRSQLWNAPRTNPLFLKKIRAALRQYRQHQSALRGLQSRRAQGPAKGGCKNKDWNSLSDEALQEYLELRYGLVLAQSVMDQLPGRKAA